MAKFKKKRSALRQTRAFFYKTIIGKLLTDANLAYVKGNLELAMQKLKEAIIVSPRCHQAYFSMGLICEEKEDYQNAYQLFKLCFCLKPKNDNLLDKLCNYSKEFGYLDQYLNFLERKNDKSRFNEMIEIAKKLGLTEKVIEYQIERDNVFEDEFILSIPDRLLKKFFQKNMNEFINQFEKHKNSGLFDKMLKKLYDNENFDVISDLRSNIKNYNFSLKNRLIFNISQIKTSNHIFTGNLENYYDYDVTCKDLFFKLAELRIDVLEFLTTVEDLESQKEALKKMAERSFTCDKHDENHKCNLYYYLEYLKIMPTDNQIRLIIYSIYNEKGDIENAKKYSDYDKFSFPGYESAAQFFKKAKDKKALRFSHADCIEMRKIYFMTLEIRKKYYDVSDEERETYRNLICLLLNDFFTNLYIFPSNIGSLKAYASRHEKNECKDEIKYLSLHGLEPFEWLDVIKMNFYSAIETEKDAFKIIYKALDASIFKDSVCFFNLAFMFIKYSVILNNLDYLSEVIKKMYRINQTSYNLYHFLLNFFVDYNNNPSYRKIYTNTRRIIERTYQKQQNIIDHGLYLSSHIYFNLYPVTLDKIDKLYQKEKLTPQETTLLAIIFFNNSKSRKITNRNYYIQRGINLLKSLEKIENDGYIFYNIGRAYHYYGLNGFAEMYYKKCLNTDYKQFAIYNLILIYKKNNSESLIQDILNFI